MVVEQDPAAYDTLFRPCCEESVTRSRSGSGGGLFRAIVQTSDAVHVSRFLAMDVVERDAIVELRFFLVGEMAQAVPWEKYQLEGTSTA